MTTLDQTDNIDLLRREAETGNQIAYLRFLWDNRRSLPEETLVTPRRLGSMLSTLMRSVEIDLELRDPEDD
jgi:hypothetical protein